jgi:hypothetical protein
MPSETKTTPRSPSSLEGQLFRPTTSAERVDAIEKAFDYRGDVTLELTNGQRLDGYLFNRDALASPPCLEMFLPGSDHSAVVPYADIAAIAFTGRDTADGKSWRDWMTKKHSERQAEAQRLRDEARSLGHL